MSNVVSVSVSGVSSILLTLKHYTDELEDDLLDVCERIALEARDTAEELYAGYRGDDGDIIVVRDPKKVENGFVVSASGLPVYARDGTVGNTVMFAEFGSGTTAGWHPKVAEFGAYPGSWSEHDAQQYSTFGFWEHNGQRYTHIEPTRAMYYAFERGKMVADEYMREVFR